MHFNLKITINNKFTNTKFELVDCDLHEIVYYLDDN